MGKAYSEEEKETIRKRIWDVGLEMFHQEQNKTLNIRELTERVGISLGSYYNFYKDKKSLVNDIMVYRVNQKLDIMRTTFEDSLDNPIQYVSDILYNNFLDMGEKVQNKAIYKEMYELTLQNDTEEMYLISNIYTQIIRDLSAYWKENGVLYKIDEEGIMSLIFGVSCFYDSAKYMKKQYFEELLHEFILSGVMRYIKSTGRQL